MSHAANPDGPAKETREPAKKAHTWGRWLDASLLVGVGLFLLYRFVGTGMVVAPESQGLSLLPPSDRPVFVELSSTR